MRNYSIKRSFTLIEIIITFVLVGIIMVPLGLMSMEYMRSIVFNRDSHLVEGLARLEMAKINNLSFSDITLADGYDITTSSYEGYDYDLRRTVDNVAGWSSDLKQVQVRLFPSGESGVHLINLITYIADVSFGVGSGGGGVGGGSQADSFALTAGKIKKKKLEKITIENTGGSEIIWTIVTVTFTGDSGITMNKIKRDKTTLWTGTANSGDTITLDSSLTMDAGKSYNKLQFEFTKNLSTITINYFEFEDLTQSGSYSW